MSNQLNLFKIIEVEVLENGTLPKKANLTDAGWDVFATKDELIEYGVISKIPLNIKMALPKNCYVRIETKSGLGSRGMLVYAGIIDEEDPGIPHVVCTCLIPGKSLKINKGEKIAQMIIEPFDNTVQLIQVDKVSTDTTRSSGGFGSTGA